MAYSRSHHKRTVRCSYCYESGHNRSSCPKHAAKIEEIRATDPNSWQVARYDEKKAKRARKGKDRKCSYCDTKGHNRATCPELKAHMAITKEQNAEYRKMVYGRLQHHGLFAGALVNSDRNRQPVNPQDYDCNAYYRQPMVIKAVNWMGINFWNHTYQYFDNDDISRQSPFMAVPLNNLSKPWFDNLGWPIDKDLLTHILGESTANEWLDGTHWRAEEASYYFIEVQSPVPTQQPPKGWLEAEDKAMKLAYKKRSSYMGPIRRHDPA